MLPKPLSIMTAASVSITKQQHLSRFGSHVVGTLEEELLHRVAYLILVRALGTWHEAS